MERTPALLMVLAIAACCGLVAGQRGEIRPPAPPRGGVPRPLVRAPAPPPFAAGEEPRPPAPPPTTDRACVVRHVGGGEFRKECVDIAARCEERSCPAGTVCALNLDEELECFPESVKEFQSCLPDFLRLSQPCPADSGIRGFGMGCNYCVGGNPFEVPEPRPPGEERDSESRQLSVSPPAPVSTRACVVKVSEQGVKTGECIDISARCEAKKCPAIGVCALDLFGDIVCLNNARGVTRNCQSEASRLETPCPNGSPIAGFGMGCTLCFGNPNRPEPPSPSVFPTRLLGVEGRIEPPAPPPPGPPGPPPVGRACPVVHVRNGEFRSQCVDISEKCAQQGCAADEVCGLTHDETLKCFPGSVRDFQHCGSEEERLRQPCPADAGITGFGMGCTFCVGGNPFASPSRTFNRRQLELNIEELTIEESFGADSACVVLHVEAGNFKRECRSIKTECDERQCPGDTVCGLDLDENITCFPASVKEFENCAPDAFRLQQPCPADAGIRGFGMGCTFCRGGNPFAPVPVPEPVGPPIFTGPSGQTMAAGSDQSITNQVACVSRVTADGEVRRNCTNISDVCQRLDCPADQTCALDINEQPSCFANSELPIQNCGTTLDRVREPCPAGTEVVAFGAGCTYCRAESTGQDMAAGSDQSITDRVACVSRITSSGELRRGCMDITDLCQRRRCPADRTCALDINEQPSCFAASQLPIRNCGSTAERVEKPCPTGTEVVAFGAGCTYCRAPPTAPPPPPAGAPRRACIVSGRVRRCEAIESRCEALACADTCALGLDGEPRCFSAAELPTAYCGPERRRLDQPCPAGQTAVAFGAGCTYCRPLSAASRRSLAGRAGAGQAPGRDR